MGNINEVQKVTIRNLVELAKKQAVPVGGYAIVDPGNGTLPKGDPKAALLPTGEDAPLARGARRHAGLDAENEGWKQIRLLLGQPDVGKEPTHIVLVTPFSMSGATGENANKKWVLERLADGKNKTTISTVVVGESSLIPDKKLSEMYINPIRLRVTKEGVHYRIDGDAHDLESLPEWVKTNVLAPAITGRAAAVPLPADRLPGATPPPAPAREPVKDKDPYAAIEQAVRTFWQDQIAALPADGNVESPKDDAGLVNAATAATMKPIRQAVAGAKATGKDKVTALDLLPATADVVDATEKNETLRKLQERRAAFVTGRGADLMKFLRSDDVSALITEAVKAPPAKARLPDEVEFPKGGLPAKRPMTPGRPGTER